jgi:hypothetical protein
MSGNFAEKNFQKKLSENFYITDKFIEKFRDFTSDLNPEGPSGKKLAIQLAKKDISPAEIKKGAERLIVTMNGTAKDLFEEFYGIYLDLSDIIQKIHQDSESAPPKYVRNIHTIGGLKNTRFLNTLDTSHRLMSSLKEIMRLLKE